MFIFLELSKSVVFSFRDLSEQKLENVKKNVCCFVSIQFFDENCSMKDNLSVPKVEIYVLLLYI